MLHLKSGFLVLALAAVPLTSACATSAPSDSGTQIVLGAVASSKQEAEDASLLDTATEAFQSNGYAGLKPHLAKLREALNRAPASYATIEQQANGNYIVRANDMMDGLILSAAASSAASKGTTVVQGPNVYPMIALMLGSEAVERADYTTAHVYLDRGLALQPEHWTLLSEKAAAYIGQKKWQEALAVADKGLASNDIMIAMHSDVLLRKRGYALVELDRLEEARAAYQEALEFNADDEISKHELEYIDKLIASRPHA